MPTYNQRRSCLKKKMICKPIILIFLVYMTWGVMTYSQGIPDRGSLSCIKSLLPCQPYLKGSSSPPTSCCMPLKQIIADDSQCLCTLFHDVAILKSFNVTKDDAINLAKSCGANTHKSICQTAVAPSAPDTSSTNSSETAAAPPRKSAAMRGYDQNIGSMRLFAFLSVLVSAFF